MFSQSVSNIASNNCLEMANKELTEIARRSEPSVLRKRSYEGMCEENWMTQITHELSSRCPVVKDILSKLLDITHHPEKKIAAMNLIYGILMFLRCHELSRIQRINTILLTQGHASTDVSILFILSTLN